MRRVLPTILLIGAAVGLTVIGGILHGRISHRWGPGRALLDAGQILKRFPRHVGPWQMRESFELSQGVIDQLECAGYIDRRYMHRQTGASVRVALMVGPAGPMSVHEPEVCYDSAGYRLAGRRTKTTIGDPGNMGPQSQFWTVTFESPDVDKSTLRVRYAWWNGQRWEAPEHPRITYAGRAFLYKIELAALLPRGADPEQDDPSESFLAEFVSAFRKHVSNNQADREPRP